MSKYSNILVCGDSFSVPDYKILEWDLLFKFNKEKAEFNKTKRYICWPELLAEHYKVKCKNLSNNGRGADYIVNNITDEITSNQNYDLVIAAMSPWNRSELRRIPKPFPLEIIRIFVDDFLRNLLYLKCVCKEFNIPLIVCQMINPIQIGFHAGSDKEIKAEFSKAFVNNEISLGIDSSDFIGWPFLTNLGGYDLDKKYLTIDDRLREIWHLKSKNFALHDDYHPNQLGHQKLCNVFIKKINEKKIFNSSR